MSKIQGIVSANSGQVVVDEGTGNVVSTHDVHQIHAAIQVNVGERTTEDHNHDTYSNESSSETVRNVLDKGNILNMKINETDDETMNLKEHEMIEERNSVTMKPVSPFAKFRELDRQNSHPKSPSTPQMPGKGSIFKFTNDSGVQINAVQIKERLLSWCRAKTEEYENVQIDNFSTSWSNGLAFCALLHHFKPEAFDYSSLTPHSRRKNFQLAFEIADEAAGIAPLLDVEDMVTMRKPDWKCVFTYVQSIYRRFKDED